MKAIRSVKRFDVALLLLLLAMIAAGGYYVNRTSERFEARIKVQSGNNSHDVARIVTALQALEADLRAAQFGNPLKGLQLVSASKSKLQGLVENISTTHDYEPETAKTDALQIAVPLVNDVSVWLENGIGDFAPGSSLIYRILSQRLYLARVELETIDKAAAGEVLGLLQNQSNQLRAFGRSLILLLAGLCVLLILAGLLYVRNRQAREHLWHERKLVSDAINNINDGFILTAPDGRAQVVNNALKSMSKPLAAELESEACYSAALNSVIDAGHLVEIDARSLATTSDIRNGRTLPDTFRSLYRTGEGLFLRVTERETVDRGRVITLTDITDLKLTEDKLQYQANFDFLTGIANRSHYVEKLNTAIARAKRHGHKVALLQFDLDRFKQINDTLGHAVGDELLIHTASRIKRNLREVDLAARTGGDEFVAIIDQISDQKEAIRSAERIMAELYQALEIDGMQIDFSASMGIALYPDHAHDPTSLMQHADIACYHAKASGRNNYQMYGSDLKVQSIELMTLESKLRTAIEKDQLFVDYQPYLHLATGKLCGVEAFSRWYDSNLGLVSPAQFIPVAEKNGLIAKLGEQVLYKVFSQLQQWQAQGLGDIQVAINVSQRQLFQPTLAATIDRLATEFGVDPGCLLFEITEGVITEDTEAASQHLHRLAERNIRFVLDDYGKGNSSLHRIKNLPIAALKIDGDFIRRIATDQSSREIVSAMISSANNLQLETIAECVESEDQAALLKEMGCTMIQGFLIGEPQTPALIGKRYNQEVIALPVKKIA